MYSPVSWTFTVDKGTVGMSQRHYVQFSGHTVHFSGRTLICIVLFLGLLL